MGRKPKAGGTPKQDPEQSARFIEAARQVGVDEREEAFEEAFRRIARAPPPRKGDKAGNAAKAPRRPR